MNSEQKAKEIFNKIFEHQKEGYKGGFNDESAWSSYTVKSEDIIVSFAKALSEAHAQGRLEGLEEAAKVAENFEIADEVSSRIRALGEKSNGAS